MTDFTLAASITRTSLGLGDLDLNDHVNFAISVPFLGGTGRYVRNLDSSAYMDGEIEINAHLPNITETVGLEVFGANYAAVMTNAGLALAAFKQAQYTLTVVIAGHTHTWRCQRADWSYEINTGRVSANQVKFQFDVPRSPLAVAGEF
jgi:hypothetical protein